MSITKHTLGIWIVAAIVPALVACAQGVGGEVGDDDEVDAKAIDAPQVVDAPQGVDASQPVDARLIDARLIDASPLIDAPILPIDGGGGGPFCATNAECTVSGTCCLLLPGAPLGACVEGEVVFGVCLPG